MVKPYSSHYPLPITLTVLSSSSIDDIQQVSFLTSAPYDPPSQPAHSSAVPQQHSTPGRLAPPHHCRPLLPDPSSAACPRSCHTLAVAANAAAAAGVHAAPAPPTVHAPRNNTSLGRSPRRRQAVAHSLRALLDTWR